MLNEQNANDVIGTTAYGSDGDKIGKVGQLYLDDSTGRPEFVTVNTGFFGTSESFVPAGEADLDGDRLVVPFSKEKVKGAPNVNVDDGHLDSSDEQRLYEYYGLAYSGTSDTGHADTGTTGTDTGVATGTTGHTSPAGHDTSGPNTDDAMTRSEEELRVGTAERETGRARLRKYVTTEEETRTVPVRKERAVLETEPITDGNDGSATDGPAISEEDHEVTLSEEEVVVSKKATPKERVRLGTETVTDEETVTENVQKEHIETEGDVDHDRR